MQPGYCRLQYQRVCILQHERTCQVSWWPDGAVIVAQVAKIVKHKKEVVAVAGIVPEPKVGYDQVVALVHLHV